MPEIRHYTVTETRRVRVTANSAEDATRIAAAAFRTGQNSDNGVRDSNDLIGVWGNTSDRIRVTGMTVSDNA